MGMDALLCSLSPKRLAMIEEDPDVLSELIEARQEQEIPGLLDLGPTWHALDIMLGDGKDPVFADALVARTGKPLKAGGSKSKARMIPAARVAEISKALSALPVGVVRERYAGLYGKTVNGGFGQELVAPDDKDWLREKVTQNQKAEIELLTAAFTSVVALYKQAAAAKHSMMSVII
ncbi:MAG: hypothetical protein H6Q90_4274 [Deltaproteobacteria bacterium]|nr:hypothetical protein [Deltaproteobacteria bacterium]